MCTYIARRSVEEYLQGRGWHPGTVAHHSSQLRGGEVHGDDHRQQDDALQHEGDQAQRLARGLRRLFTHIIFININMQIGQFGQV